MRKLLFVTVIAVFLFQAGAVQADKSQAVFSIQKARSAVEKVRIRGEEMKATTDELDKARRQLDQAEEVLKKNTSLLGMGGLKKEAEPEIQYYVEMAEINTAIVASRLEKISQEKENARLEKLIPEVESKIKVFADKNAEISRLKQELNKPKKETSGSQIALLAREKGDLAEQISKLNADREALNGKIQVLNRRVEYTKALGKFRYLSRTSDKGYTLIVPRKELFRATTKGPTLTAGGEQLSAKVADFIRSFPENKLEVVVHGAGSPAKSEDLKATEAMAGLLKNAFVKAGIGESSIKAIGSGPSEPIFSKGAVEENRRVEITFYE